VPLVLVWPDIFGLRPAFRQMGKRLAESGYAVLVVNPFYRVKPAPTAAQGASTPIPQLLPLMQALTETTHMSDAKAFIAWLDQQAVRVEDEENRHAGLLHGRPDRLPHGRSRSRSRRRRRLVSRRRARNRHAEQPAPRSVRDQGAVPHRHRRERRHAIAE